MILSWCHSTNPATLRTSERMESTARLIDITRKHDVLCKRLSKSRHAAALLSGTRIVLALSANFLPGSATVSETGQFPKRETMYRRWGSATLRLATRHVRFPGGETRTKGFRFVTLRVAINDKFDNLHEVEERDDARCSVKERGYN
ncbi:hypothetical protein EVAR_71560_1 [Eumeta japonica]|uniref:Uncharacterized protein n=1 Tax=Eumeta variegata TaxID=151549 RepID=A0A4C1SJP9_EUMVA|nr:hypothetical protein EVAR_71560_1 [Eumeta japonica]